jgi:hypothetical protein
MWLGDVDAAEKEMAVYAGRVTELRQPARLWQVTLFQGMRSIMEGRLAEAEALSQQALTIGQRSVGTNAMLMYGAQIASIRREQGRMGELEPVIAGMVQQYPPGVLHSPFSTRSSAAKRTPGTNSRFWPQTTLKRCHAMRIGPRRFLP